MESTNPDSLTLLVLNNKDFQKPVMEYLEVGRLLINQKYRDAEPWQLIFGTFGATLILVWIYELLFQQEPLWSRFKKSFFKNVKKLPIIRGKIAEEISTTATKIEEDFAKGTKGLDYIRKLPLKGLTQAEVKKELKKYKEIAIDWTTGKCSGTVYNGGDDLTKLMSEVYSDFAWTNPLHPDTFPEIRKMEAEVVRMTCTMFNGGPETCGTMTSGGTESIMLACKAYRDLAYDRGIKQPDMIVPVTAHAAFDKAAHFFNIYIKHCAVDAKTGKANVASMRSMITKNTCMLVGSAPSFSYGVMDPIYHIAKLGKKYNIPVHVDSCLGGFLVPFMKHCGYELDPFDFTVEGVTSISADSHKYGFAPKGSSVIMYSDQYHRKFQYFVQPDWPGGIYASPTIAGSRAGALIAGTWTTMMYYGLDGYIQSTKSIIQVAKYVEQGIRKIKHIYVCGEPEVSVIGIGSHDFDIYRLSDDLAKKGWNLNPLQYPSSFHICCTLLHTKEGVADLFLKDVQDSVDEIMKDPKAKCKGMGALYGMAQTIPDRTLVSEMVSCFYDGYYSTGKDTVQANGKA